MNPVDSLENQLKHFGLIMAGMVLLIGSIGFALVRTGRVGGGAWGYFIFQMKMNSLCSDTIFFIEK